MSVRAFVVTLAEILAQQTRSLNPLDYDNDAKRAGLEREAQKLRERAATLTVRAEGLEARARALPTNRTYLTKEDK